MTDRIGPFDKADFTQDQWYRSAKLWAPSGVFGGPASSASTGGLAMTTSGLAVTIGPGTGLSRGCLFDRDAGATVPGGSLNGNASLSRRDRIVLRRDLAAKTCVPVWLTGTPSASQDPPDLTQVDTGVWDTPLFSFLVPPNNGTAITGIVDERGWIDAVSGRLSFFTTAARDANIPDPPDGATCYVSSPGVYYDGFNGAWKQRPTTNNAGTSGVLAGSPPPSGQAIDFKTFFASVTFNSNGDGVIVFPGGPYAHGLLFALASHISIGGQPSNDLEFVPWEFTASLSSISLRCYAPNGSAFGGTGVALNLLLAGW